MVIIIAPALIQIDCLLKVEKIILILDSNSTK